jgi:hypothetical protein
MVLAGLLIAALQAQVAAASAQGQVPAAMIPPIPVAKATVTGTVLSAATGEPLPRTQVTLIRVFVPPAAPLSPQQLQQQRDAPPVIIPPVTTDNQGRFQISGIEAGKRDHRRYRFRSPGDYAEFEFRSARRPAHG